MAGEIIGPVMIIAACMGFGYRLSLKQILRKEELMSLKNAVSNILSNLEYGRMTFEEALSEAIEDIEDKEVYTSVIKALRNNNSIKTAWKHAFDNIRKDTYMTLEDIDRIIRLGEGFSSGDMLLQKKYCDSLIKYIDAEAESIGASSSENSKLYRSVSITIGIFIVVLLV